MQRTTSERAIHSTDAQFRRIGIKATMIGMPECGQNLFLSDPSTSHPLQAWLLNSTTD